MLVRFKNSLLFRFEQFMMRGPIARFSIILVLVVLVSLVTGTLVRQITPGFESTGDAIWWAFLRLTDPGYLGDDHGVAKATVSTGITVLGYILFMGALIAILVQWLNQTMERLELGLTPVALDGHIVILGWSTRTPAILKEILVSQGRVERFPRQRGTRRLRVALLVERANAALLQQLKSELGEHWNARQIILRSGSALSLDDLMRVDFLHARAILIPTTDITTAEPFKYDAHTAKTLMTLSTALEEDPPEEPPLAVAEVRDTRHVRMLRSLYQGPLELIASDKVVNRGLVQTVRQPGLSHIIGQFLSDFESSQIYVREEAQLVGTSIQQLTYAFPAGVPLGLVRPRKDGFQALLNPPNNMRVEAGDRIVVLAPSYQDAAPPQSLSAAVDLPEKPAPECPLPGQRRVLIVGWNHRVPTLLSEFASYPKERFVIDIVSQMSAANREKHITALALSRERVQIRQVEFDYTVKDYLHDLDPASYDNVILLAINPGAESDARTLLAYLWLCERIPAGAERPRVVIELTDPGNIPLFAKRVAEVIDSLVIVSHLMARVALRREMRAVFKKLFGSGGNEILFCRIADYGLAEILAQIPDYDLTETDYTFADLQQAADAVGQIAIGIRRAGQEHTPHGGVELNPPHKQNLNLNENDELIVLTTYGYE